MSRQEVQSVVDAAIREAILRRHEYITVEHLLYSILQHDTGSAIVDHCGGDIDELLEDLLQFFIKHVPEFPSRSNDGETIRKALSPVQTLGFRRVIERTLQQMTASGKNDLDVGDLLASILLEQDSHAVYLLKSQGIERIDVLNFISHGIAKEGDDLLDHRRTR